MKRPAAVVAVLAVAAAVAGLLFALRPSDNAPRGYERMGPLGSAVVYAKHDAESVSVIVREGSQTLCDGAGPLDGPDAPAVCNGTAGTTYVYVAQVRKDSAPPALCETQTGASAPAKTLTTPDSWPVNFVAVIQTTNSPGSGANDCARLNAD